MSFGPDLRPPYHNLSQCHPQGAEFGPGRWLTVRSFPPQVKAYCPWSGPSTDSDDDAMLSFSHEHQNRKQQQTTMICNEMRPPLEGLRNVKGAEATTEGRRTRWRESAANATAHRSPDLRLRLRPQTLQRNECCVQARHLRDQARPNLRRPCRLWPRFSEMSGRFSIEFRQECRPKCPPLSCRRDEPRSGCGPL